MLNIKCVEDQRRFSFDDAIPRFMGYLKAFADSRQNRQSIDVVRERKNSSGDSDDK